MEMILSTASGKVEMGSRPLMSSSLNKFHKGDELGAWNGSRGIQDEVGVVQDLLFAAVLDRQEHLSGHLMLLENLSLRSYRCSFFHTLCSLIWGET